MKKSNVILLALFAFAFGARAVEVSPDDASLAVAGWGLDNARTFANGAFGAVESVTPELASDGSVLWYVVKTTHGAAVVSPDTEIVPVIAFLPESDGVIPAGSPLRAMLERDLPARIEAAKAVTAKLAAGGAKTRNASRWARLKRRGAGVKTAAGGSPSTIVRWLDGWNSTQTIDGIQTLRFWNQTGSSRYFRNERVFDLYTPTNSAGMHAACGCVATAGASVIHYFRIPAGPEGFKQKCTNAGEPLTLVTIGGAYDWSLIDSLDLHAWNAIALSDEAVELLGRVAYDCGVSCKMGYFMSEDGSSGAFTRDLAVGLREQFGFANVQCANCGTSSDDIGADAYTALIYNQIRGGAPVVMGIDGHEVVAAGYGVDADAVDYTFVFLGWGGQCDGWYTLPEIDTKATVSGGNYVSTFISEVITEIAVDDRYIPLVGHVVDAWGEPVEGSPITLSSGETVLTDANGYWGARVSPTNECWFLDERGNRYEYAIGKVAKTTKSAEVQAASLAAAMPEAFDIVLESPVVEVWDGGDLIDVKGSLDLALAVAATCADPRIEIIGATCLKGNVVVDFNCPITVAADPAEAVIEVYEGASLSVDSGFSVSLTDTVFTGASDDFLSVGEGGVLKVSGTCSLGTVTVFDSNAFYLAGELSVPFGGAVRVRFADGLQYGDAFGLVASGVSAESMARVLNDEQRDFGGVLGGVGVLVWGDVPVDPVYAAAYVQLAGVSEKVYYRTLDQVFAQCTNDQRVVVLRDIAAEEFTAPVTIANAVSIASEGIVPVVIPDKTASITVADGGAVTVTDITFAAYSGPGFITVADGGRLTLGSGACLDGLVSKGRDVSRGPLAVMGGELTVCDGASIVDCRASGSLGGLGGGIYISKGTLNLEGGVITGCSAGLKGGGIYAYCGDSYAKVNVSGPVTVIGNTLSGSGAVDNLWVRNGEASFAVVGPVCGQVGVKISKSVSGGRLGESFATVGATLSGDDLAATLRSFSCDLDASFGAQLSADGSALVWGERIDDGSCEPDVAVCRVIVAGAVTSYYSSVSAAFARVGSDAVVELLADDVLVDDVEIRGAVTLRAAEGVTATLGRTLAAYPHSDYRFHVVAGASLTVSNLTVSGEDIFYIPSPPEINPMTGEEVSDGYVGPHGRLIFADGGTVVLQAGAEIRDVNGGNSRADSAVVVWNGGLIRMEDGSSIHDCYNLYYGGAADYALGAGVLVDGEGSVGEFRGGDVYYCVAVKGAGVAICNHAVARVSGTFSCSDNFDRTYAPSDFLVEDESEMFLDGELDGYYGLGRIEGVLASADEFGKVPGWASWNLDVLTNSVARFFHDTDGDVGVVVTNASPDALLVWKAAVREVGAYTAPDGTVYYPVAVPDDEPLPPPPPPPPEYEVVTNVPTAIAFRSIVRSASEGLCTVVLTNLVKDASYTLFTATTLADEAFAPVTNFTAEADGPFEFSLETAAGALFWRAIGETTYVTNSISE